MKSIEPNNEDILRLFRAVGVEEFYLIMTTNCFACHPNGVSVKYFGVDFEETLNFADKAINIELVAVVEVGVLRDVVMNIADFTHVDRFLFKSGTVEIPAANLSEFNSAIRYIIHKS